MKRFDSLCLFIYFPAKYTEKVRKLRMSILSISYLEYNNLIPLNQI